MKIFNRFTCSSTCASVEAEPMYADVEFVCLFLPCDYILWLNYSKRIRFPWLSTYSQSASFLSRVPACLPVHCLSIHGNEKVHQNLL